MRDSTASHASVHRLEGRSILPALLKMLAVASVCAVLAQGFACSSGEDCAVGSEGCACTPGGACNPGLTCLSSICVNRSGAGGAPAATGGQGGAGAMSAALDATQMCAAICMQLYTCDNTKDVQICRSGCLNDLTVFFSKLRPDALGEIDGCLKRKDCATVLKGSAAAFSTCAAEAQASRAPSAVGTDFCNRYEAATTRCGQVGFNRAKCLDEVKLYKDAVIMEGIACTDKACTLIESCVDTTFDS
jgi:hypothetical protein